MNLHLRIVLLLSCTFCSNFALALDNWWQAVVSEQPYHQVTSEIQNGGSWYLCEPDLVTVSSSAESLCLDDFHYYHQHLYGEVSFEEEIANFVFVNHYQWQNWNDLILSLRKDGFVMRSMQFDDAEYDVASALNQKSAEQVDKEVILMMNRYPPEARRTIEWVRAGEFDSISPSLKVMIKSDGEMIEMHVTRF